jgi:hypothetical protein
MLINLTEANFQALFWSLRWAKGIAVTASTAKIAANHFTYCVYWGYLISAAMLGALYQTIIKKRAEVNNSESKEVL